MNQDAITALLTNLIHVHPTLAAVIGLLTALRPLAHAAMTVLDNYAKQNFSPDEYAKVVHIETSRAFKTASWLLDLASGVKLHTINGALQAAANKTPEDKSGDSTSGGSTLKLILLSLIPVPLMVACGTIDPALPGQNTPAPFLAFTNGAAYLLGHSVSSNNIYTAAETGTQLGVAALVKDVPSATNYLPAAQAVFSAAANSGVYSSPNLLESLNRIVPSTSADQAVIDALAQSALSLAGVYVGPLISKDTNSAPYIQAALKGIAAGL